MTIVDNYREMCQSLNLHTYAQFDSWRRRISKEDFESHLRAHRITPEQHDMRYVREALQEERTPEQRPSTESRPPVLRYPQCSPILRHQRNRDVAEAVIQGLVERLAIHHKDDGADRREYLSNRLREWEVFVEEWDRQHASSSS